MHARKLGVETTTEDTSTQNGDVNTKSNAQSAQLDDGAVTEGIAEGRHKAARQEHRVRKLEKNCETQDTNYTKIANSSRQLHEVVGKRRRLAIASFVGEKRPFRPVCAADSRARPAWSTKLREISYKL